MASSRLSRCFTGFLFWPSVSWLFLAHLLPHLSAWFLPGAIPWPKIPWPRSVAFCHAIILKNVGICMRPISRSASGLRKRGYLRSIRHFLVLLSFFLATLQSEGWFSLMSQLFDFGFIFFLELEMTGTWFWLVHTFCVSLYVVCVSSHASFLWAIWFLFNSVLVLFSSLWTPVYLSPP